MKTSLTLRVEKEQKSKYKTKAEEDGTSLSAVGRELLDAWLSGRILLNTIIRVGHKTIDEVK